MLTLLCAWWTLKEVYRLWVYDIPRAKRESAELKEYTDWYVGLDRSTLTHAEIRAIERETDLVVKMHNRNWDYHGIIRRRLERIRRGGGTGHRHPRPATTTHFRG